MKWKGYGRTNSRPGPSVRYQHQPRFRQEEPEATAEKSTVPAEDANGQSHTHIRKFFFSQLYRAY